MASLGAWKFDRASGTRLLRKNHFPDARKMVQQNEGKIVSIEEHEKHLHKMLQDIRLRRQQEAKPIIDQLVRLEQLKPPRPVHLILNDDLQKFLISINPLSRKDFRNFGTSISKVAFDGENLKVSNIPLADTIKLP